jgi:hypothetical protein
MLIPLTKDKVAIIDDEDAEIILKHSWHALCPNGVWYAYNGHRESMHQFLLGKKKGAEIHHKNNNGLDNRRSNLEHITHAENVAIAYKDRRGTTQTRSGKWQAQISINRRYINLGLHNTEEEAHEAYLAGRLQHRGF